MLTVINNRKRDSQEVKSNTLPQQHMPDKKAPNAYAEEGRVTDVFEGKDCFWALIEKESWPFPKDFEVALDYLLREITDDKEKEEGFSLKMVIPLSSLLNCKCQTKQGPDV